MMMIYLFIYFLSGTLPDNFPATGFENRFLLVNFHYVPAFSVVLTWKFLPSAFCFFQFPWRRWERGEKVGERLEQDI